MGTKSEHLAATNAASYDRSWFEIDSLLEQAVQEMKKQRAKYKLRKMTGSKADRMRALMKYTRAKAVVDTLRWTIGTRGQLSPLDQPLQT
ncbi:MAG: hypothetical protein VW982_02175 [Candidatus Poseidoniales archaeon]|jgi:hypothetical protein